VRERSFAEYRRGIDSNLLDLGVAEAAEGEHMDQYPDYDASDELEYGFAAFAWLLRGNYPPPYYGSN
jgi:hypothetical protein